METKQKLFAFKLAAKEDAKQEQVKDAQWKGRDGVAIAGCTDYKWPGNLRYTAPGGAADRGVYC